MWEVPWEIEGIQGNDGQVLSTITSGMDAMDALIRALIQIGEILAVTPEGRNGRLFWLGEPGGQDIPNLGFPVWPPGMPR